MCRLVSLMIPFLPDVMFRMNDFLPFFFLLLESSVNNLLCNLARLELSTLLYCSFEFEHRECWSSSISHILNFMLQICFLYTD